MNVSKLTGLLALGAGIIGVIAVLSLVRGGDVEVGVSSLLVASCVLVTSVIIWTKEDRHG